MAVALIDKGRSTLAANMAFIMFSVILEAGGYKIDLIMVKL